MKQPYLGTSPQDSVRVHTLTGVSGTNTITANATPGVPSLLRGNLVTFVPAATNTGATTLNIDGIGAKSIYKNNAALVGGELAINVPVVCFYDGTVFHIVGGSPVLNNGTLSADTVAADTYSIPDPFTFSSGTMANNLYWNGASHNGVMWVAHGGPGGYSPLTTVNYSFDGVTWYAATNTYTDKNMVGPVLWNGSLWAGITQEAINPGTGQTSTNGIAWTPRTTTNADTGFTSLQGTTWPYGNLFVGTVNLAKTYLFTSTNGYTFTSTGTLPVSQSWGAFATNGTVSVIFPNGVYTASTIAASINGVTLSGSWTQRTLPTTVNNRWKGVWWTGRCFIGIPYYTADGSTTTGCRSYDGATWSTITLPTPVTTAAHGTPSFNAGGAIALPIHTQSGNGQHTWLYTSEDDGNTWTLRTLSQGGQWNISVSDGSKVVAIDSNVTGGPTNKTSYSAGGVFLTSTTATLPDVIVAGNTFGTDTSGNVFSRLAGTELATTATDGFFYIPTCNGIPTGTPTNMPPGVAPLVYDRKNKQLYIYYTAWTGVGVLPITGAPSTKALVLAGAQPTISVV